MKKAFHGREAVKLGFVLSTVLIFSLAATTATGQNGSCPTIVIGPDSTHAGNSAGSGAIGRSVGQSFLAPDTLIRSLTVWRVAIQGSSAIGLRPFIAEITELPGYIQIDRVLYVGATIVDTTGDGVHSTPFHWEFEPPIALPRTGVYAFFLGMNPCLAYVDVLSTAEDAGLYPDGILMESGRGQCTLSSLYAEMYPRADLNFQMEFCHDVPTPIRRTSWGKLKTIYR